MHLRVKPEILQHRSSTHCNHQAQSLVVLKCPVLQSLEADSIEDLNNQSSLNVCYARSVASSDTTKEKLLTNWTELRVFQERQCCVVVNGTTAALTAGGAGTSHCLLKTDKCKHRNSCG